MASELPESTSLALLTFFPVSLKNDEDKVKVRLK
jgi:hypothetical protein